MRFMKELLRIIKESSASKKGVQPSFKEYHALKALLYIFREGPLGRKPLSKYLGIGETSTRTLICRLRKKGVIDTTKASGAYLTDKGEHLIRNFLKHIKILKPLPTSKLGLLKLGNYAYLVLLHGKCSPKTKAIEIRDKIVKYGAKAALIICVMKNKLVLCSSNLEDFSEENITELLYIKDSVKNEIEDHDLIVISYGDSLEECEKSILLFIINFLGDKNDNFN